MSCNKFNRIIRSISKEYIVTAVTVFIAGIGIIVQRVSTLSSNSQINGFGYLIPWCMVGLAISFLIIGYQSYLSYQRNTYDPALALKYDDIFNEMDGERFSAAKTLMDCKSILSKVEEYKKQLEPIDDVLDFLDTLGFLLNGDQISDIVMHQYFYHWIRGYWVFSEAYIRAWQNKEKSRWENIENLFETVLRIEIKLCHSTRKEQFEIPQKDKFLEEEIRVIRAS